MGKGGHTFLSIKGKGLTVSDFSRNVESYGRSLSRHGPSEVRMTMPEVPKRRRKDVHRSSKDICNWPSMEAGTFGKAAGERARAMRRTNARDPRALLTTMKPEGLITREDNSFVMHVYIRSAPPRRTRLQRFSARYHGS